MDLEKVLAQLRAELENIDTAILSLERLQRRGVRRGRPPSWLANLKEQRAQPRRPNKTGGNHNHDKSGD